MSPLKITFLGDVKARSLVVTYQLNKLHNVTHQKPTLRISRDAKFQV